MPEWLIVSLLFLPPYDLTSSSLLLSVSQVDLGTFFSIAVN